VEFLGMVIKHNELSMDPTKLRGIQDWPRPEGLKHLRSFLGFANFYRKFIGNYSAMARVLHELTKKDTPFRWTTEHQEAFDALKRRFQTAGTLRMPDTTKPFVIEADASKFASGGGIEATRRERRLETMRIPIADVRQDATEL